jgi:hypothetical protein
MEGYTRSNACESRGPHAKFTFVSGDNRLTAIREMPVIDVIAKDLALGGQVEPEKL